MLRHELGPELLGLLTDPKITNIHANRRLAKNDPLLWMLYLEHLRFQSF